MPSHALFFILAVVLGPLEVNLDVSFEGVLAPTGHMGSPSSHGEPPGTYCVTFCARVALGALKKLTLEVDFLKVNFGSRFDWSLGAPRADN